MNRTEGSMKLAVTAHGVVELVRHFEASLAGAVGGATGADIELFLGRSPRHRTRAG